MSLTSKAMTRGSVAAVTVIAAIALGGCSSGGASRRPTHPPPSPTKTATAARTIPSH